MHFSRLAIVALPILGAAASVVPRNDPCNPEYLQCCLEVDQSDSLPGWLYAFFVVTGVNLDSIGPAVGSECVSFDGTCQAIVVCCTAFHNYQDGLVSISTGCTPVFI